MIERSIARRYARALFDVIWPRDLYERIYRELKDVAELLESERTLKIFLQSPHVPFNRKTALLSELAQRLEWHSVTAELIKRIVKNRRIPLLNVILEELENRRLETEGYVRARVITAFELPPARRDAIVQELEKALGRKILLEQGVNPEILGGLVIQIGSIYYDASLAAQLRQLRNHLAGEETNGYRH